MTSQTFKPYDVKDWTPLDFLPGVELMQLAEPVKNGSIHRLRVKQGTVVPAHTHPADEFVLVISGVIETAGHRCEAGTFWKVPAGERQGPHVAVTDVEILTIRLGPMGQFD